MRTIHRYPLKGETGTSIAIWMPLTAVVRRIEVRPCGICLWAEVETERPLERRHFVVLATGQAIPGKSDWYQGTVFDGDKVRHVYEVLS